MNSFASVIEQLRLAASQHVDPSSLAKIVPVAGVLLIIGFFVSTLGAKFARFGVTSLFVICGAIGGLRFGQTGGFQPFICAAIGGAMMGIISFLTFRLWVGIVTGLVFASLALGGFSYQRVLPHMQNFTPTPAVASYPTIPSAEQQKAYVDRNPGQYAQDLRTYVKQQDATAERDGWLLAVATLATGVLLGVLAMRWMLILSTSVVGTILVTSGLFALLSHFAAGAYQALAAHPTVAGIGVGAFFVSSLIVQFMLTRKAPTADKG